MKVKVDYGDGSEPEVVEVTDGSVHFHPYEDDDKHEVTVTEVGDEYDPNAPDKTYAAEEGYDPSEHTVTEVIGYVEDNPDQVEEILAAEQAGKARTTLVSHLEGMRQS